MRTLKNLLLISLLLLFINSLSAQTKTTPNTSDFDSIFQGRNLAIYENGGESRDCEIIHFSKRKECELSREKAQNFLWKHWQNKKRGYIVITFVGIDYASEIHFFIEPNIKGRWHILARGKRLYGIDDVPNGEFFETEITSLQRKSATEDDIKFEKGTKFLLFLKKNGKKFISF